MEIKFPVTGIQYHGSGYYTSESTLKIGKPDGEYAVIKGVDFGKGKKGFKVTHLGAKFGTSLVEVRLDSLKGKSVGVCACGNTSKAWRWNDIVFCGEAIPDVYCDLDEAFESWCEIENTKGIHDVYLVFHTEAEYIRFAFTNESPYKEKAYTPVAAKYAREDFADTWEATDMFGRKISSDECGEKRGKYVGILYHAGKGDDKCNPICMADIRKQYPEALDNIDHVVWRKGPVFWDKPLYGFYRGEDSYVLRKHILMFAAAGVDFITFECTNIATARIKDVLSVLEALRQAKLDGINVPKVTFMLNFGEYKGTEYMLRKLYQDIYKPGLYSDLWFMYEDKPLIVAYPSSLPKKGMGETDTKFVEEIKNFFTFRMPQPDYNNGPDKKCKNKDWGWLECTPLNKYGARKDGSCEEMAVGVSQIMEQNLFGGTEEHGRSYTKKEGNACLTKDSYKYGYNFIEQWENALECDPDIVFVTGWNEWTLSVFPDKAPMGKTILNENNTQIAFYERNHSAEYSRTIEPDSKGYLDTYYFQLVNYIRKFKGTSKLPKASGEINDIKTVLWDKVKPAYINPKGTAPGRDYPGCGRTLRYKVAEGRNEILECRVARDKKNLYFYAKCADKIKDAEKENAMVLYIDTDRNHATGWEGYDFRICGKELQKSVDDRYNWEKVSAVKKEIKGDTAIITISKEVLNLKDNFDIEFKWSDNAFTGERKPGDIMDFYINGVTAPFGRFNYRYKTK